MKHCKRILREIDALEKELVKHARAEFPVGSAVCWEHGHHLRCATVLEHAGWGGSIHVEGITGARYWVDVRKLIRGLYT